MRPATRILDPLRRSTGGPHSGPRRAERADETEEPAKGDRPSDIKGSALGWFHAIA